MRTVIFIIVTMILLILLLVSSFFDNKKVTYRIALVIAFLSIIFHFYIYSLLGDNTIMSLLVSSVRSVSATLKLFGGYTLISDSDFFKVFNQNAYFAMLFYYILHILAFSMALSALVLAIGKNYIYTVYKYFLLAKPEQNYYVFFKYSDNAKKATEKLSDNHYKGKVIILDSNLYENIDSKFNDLVWKKHYIILKDDLEGNEITNLIGDEKSRKPKIKLFILDDNVDKNYELAYKFYERMLKDKGHTEVSLTVLSDEYYNFDEMQENKGYTYIRNFSCKDMISRILVREYPPCNYVDFENCKAKKDESFNCLIIGFGELGQKIFKRLFVYGQFPDCKFNCDIIDENYEKVCAEFETEFDFVLDDNISKQYDFITKNVKINTSNSLNARSKEFYKYIKDNAQRLDYIVVAVSEKTNNEIVKNLLYLRNKLDNAKFDIFDCLGNRIYAYQRSDTNQHSDSKQNSSLHRKKINIFDYILDDSVDEAGKLINYAYSLGNPEDISKVDIKAKQDKIKEKWTDEKCGAYEKNSSISAAEFYKTIIKIIGKKDDKNYEEVINYLLELPEEQKNSLGKNEHNRWCAFLLTEGYRHMDYDCKNGKRQKDIDNKKHACLIPWEDLPKLDAIQKSDTGKDPKHQERDVKNVIMAIKIAELISKNYKEINNYECK